MKVTLGELARDGRISPEDVHAIASSDGMPGIEALKRSLAAALDVLRSHNEDDMTLDNTERDARHINGNIIGTKAVAGWFAEAKTLAKGE